MQEHGALWLVKSSVMQIIWLASSILLAIPILANIICEQSNFNPKEIKKLKNALEKEVVLA